MGGINIIPILQKKKPRFREVNQHYPVSVWFKNGNILPAKIPMDGAKPHQNTKVWDYLISFHEEPDTIFKNQFLLFNMARNNLSTLKRTTCSRPILYNNLSKTQTQKHQLEGLNFKSIQNFSSYWLKKTHILMCLCVCKMLKYNQLFHNEHSEGRHSEFREP